WLCFFFLQAEDGIRDFHVTGVQTCALPISEKLSRSDRTIGDRFAEAIGAGFLERVKRGQRNGKGVYRATLPGRPSSGHPGVPKNAGVFRTPGGPEEHSLQDGLQVVETFGLQDTRGSRRSGPI